MDDSNIISWNVANWITVVIMAAIAYALFGVIQKFVASKQGS